MVNLDDATRQEIDIVEPKDLILSRGHHPYHHDLLQCGIDGIVHLFVMRRARAVVEGTKDIKEFLQELGITFRKHAWNVHLPSLPLERLEKEGIFIPKMAQIPYSYLFQVEDEIKGRSHSPLEYMNDICFELGNFVQTGTEIREIRKIVNLFNCDYENVLAYTHFRDPRFLKNPQNTLSPSFNQDDLTQEGLRERETLLSLISTYNRETKELHHKDWSEDDFKDPNTVEAGILFGQRMWEDSVRGMEEYFKRVEALGPTTTISKPDLVGIARKVIDYYSQLFEL